MIDVIHAVIHRNEGAYVAMCAEVAVVTQGGSLEEVVANLREAIALHMEGEDLEELGVSSRARLSVIYEIPDILHR